MNRKIMLIDGNSIVNRAFYGIPLLSDKNGMFTNAVYGFINIFQKLYFEERPSAVVAAFDLPAPTFRHKQFSDYKAGRKPMPNELRPQLPLLKELLGLMNIKITEIEGYEADDILGSYAKLAEADGLDAVIISGDRDLLQIATDRTKIRIPKTKGNKTEVEDYYALDIVGQLGVTPREYIDVKALMGDSSDNIPGVPGIGEKTAFKIIMEYKTVENAIANAEKITPKKASENLKEHSETALFSKMLATINTDAPIGKLPGDVSEAEIFNAEAYEKIQQLGFKSMYSLFARAETVSEKKKPATVSMILKTEAELAALVEEIKSADYSAFALIYDEDNFLGIAFSSEPNKACFATIFGEIGEQRMFELCRAYFEGENKKVCHDIKTQLTRLSEYGIEPKHLIFDTMLAAYILNASKDNYDCDDVALEYLDESLLSYEAFFGKNKTKVVYTILNNDEEKLMSFACSQSDAVYRLYGATASKIESAGQHGLYHNIELPLAHVLRDMEKLGVKIDKDALYEYGKELDTEIKTLTGEIYALSGEEFNIASPKQLGVILFEKLGLKSGKKNKTGYSTSAEVLSELSGDYPVVDKILEYRTYTKLKSTYVDGLLSEIRPDGKIHSTFNQVIASTGRISSTEPNLQNIPIRTAIGRELRKIFIPSDPSFVFLDADYSQIELRILAHISGDETFIKAFREGEDIHRITAARVFRMPEEFVSQEQRSAAKAVNFGIVYGISAFSLSKDLKIGMKEAQSYIDGYFEKYPGVKTYLDNAVASAKEKGYAETIFGRRRYIHELKSPNFNTRSFGERIAMNMPIQGSAADIIKIAMVRVHKRLVDGGFRSRLILQIHDELLVEADIGEICEVQKLLADEMQNAAKLSVPLDVEVKRGKSWYEAH